MTRAGWVLVLVALWAAPAAACDCMAMGPAFQAEAFDEPDRMLALLTSHDEVFAGRVVERVPFEAQTIAGFGANEYVFEVGRRWRGGVEDRVVISNDGWNCSYAPAFDRGDWFLVFARWTEGGGLTTEMCWTAPPIQLGHVADGWATGYSIGGGVAQLGGLGGDLFGWLDAAAARFGGVGGGERLDPSGPPTTLTVTVVDGVSGAPVPTDSTLQVGVTEWWGGVQMEGAAPPTFQRLSGEGPVRFQATLAPGLYQVGASYGDRHGVVGVIATGGARIVRVALFELDPGSL
ncbi:hypothetical protein RQM47_05920 [Rubrivirga sp. S365]|uniref:Carboxypeptidase regulatory-like domain-containing protein n=1 Tax=Rubrivirga litoralis TaxID=3075598 RepID=A0ABU3BS88_9BACT|nr:MULTISPECIES: hypothetical protein [unclassified Rubrivirga]MDT0632090.1 hypothetical protein [Rubrivirga sp. F394]MDT7856169.1 hypothetical protein [Rubrivirga sp. S365]